MKKVVVFGGTGFVGSSICKELGKAGFEVVSISKSGENKYLFEKDCEHIRFVKADLFNQAAWQEELTDCYAVVNSIGILFQQKQAHITYKRLIFEATKQIAQAAQAKGVKNFVHISAIKPPFFMLREYHQYKQEAEQYLQTKDFHLCIIRPRIIASPQKPFFLFLYHLQELTHFPFKQFDQIESVGKQVLDFVKEIPPKKE